MPGKAGNFLMEMDGPGRFAATNDFEMANQIDEPVLADPESHKAESFLAKLLAQLTGDKPISEQLELGIGHGMASAADTLKMSGQDRRRRPGIGGGRGVNSAAVSNLSRYGR